MNERIRQLADEAERYADKKIQMPGEYHPDWHDIYDEKFAELIVQECIGIVKQKWIMPDENVIAEEIKQHFGVEE
jgi:hypothetical protein